jgi:hypothetical protein
MTGQQQYCNDVKDACTAICAMEGVDGSKVVMSLDTFTFQVLAKVET